MDCQLPNRLFARVSVASNTKVEDMNSSIIPAMSSSACPRTSLFLAGPSCLLRSRTERSTNSQPTPSHSLVSENPTHRTSQQHHTDLLTASHPRLLFPQIDRDGNKRLLLTKDRTRGARRSHRRRYSRCRTLGSPRRIPLPPQSRCSHQRLWTHDESKLLSGHHHEAEGHCLTLSSYPECEPVETKPLTMVWKASVIKDPFVPNTVVISFKSLSSPNDASVDGVDLLRP